VLAFFKRQGSIGGKIGGKRRLETRLVARSADSQSKKGDGEISRGPQEANQKGKVMRLACGVRCP
jgi:hypothetical protein